LGTILQYLQDNGKLVPHPLSMVGLAARAASIAVEEAAAAKAEVDAARAQARALAGDARTKALADLARSQAAEDERLEAELAKADERIRAMRDAALTNVGDIAADAASDIVAILDAASTTSTTVVNQKSSIDSVLLNAAGLSQSGIDLLGASKDNFLSAVNTLEPTTALLNYYKPEYTCTLQGATWIIDNSKSVFGGDGRTVVLDVAFMPGNDPYTFPDNLPIVAAKGGPGGKPGCGSLPDATKNFPVRQLVTNTGWGTGLDIRPNPGIGHPCFADYFPVTRAVPEAPSVRQCLPGPAVGPEPYPGSPPYGAALYGPGGAPLWPGVPPAVQTATGTGTPP
jgi:phospholipid/cholesterol/gamma-HCH transport system substrate-binding protein